MLIGKVVFGVLLVLVAIGYDAAARRSHRDTLALTASLHDPDVKRWWIECDQPRCLANGLAARIGAGCLGLFGLIVIGTALQPFGN